MAELEAALSREVTAKTRQKDREEAHGCPTGASLALAARAGLVGTVVFIVAGTVVEDSLNAAETGAILHSVLQGAETPLSTEPAGWKGSRGAALLTLAFPTELTDKEVPAKVWTVHHTFHQIFWLYFTLGLNPDNDRARMRRGKASQQSLFGCCAAPGN